MVHWWVAPLMLLPYPLDLLPSLLGRCLSRFSGWQPDGKRVRLAFTESGDARLTGTEATGTIQRALPGVLTIGPDGATKHGGLALLISLDSPIMHASQAVPWIVVTARFPGHGPFRLPVSWSVVDVSRAVGPEPPTRLHRDDMIAIGLLKLVKGHGG